MSTQQLAQATSLIVELMVLGVRGKENNMYLFGRVLSIGLNSFSRYKHPTGLAEPVVAVVLLRIP